MGLVKSAASGDRRKTLEDLRDTLAQTIVDTESARDVAALAGRLQSVLVEIDGIAPAKEASKVDDLASRRANRHAATG